MFRSILLVTIGSLFLVGSAWADQIEGKWKREDGTILSITSCGSEFCVDVASGDYKGQRSGKLKGSNGTYSGRLKQLSTGISFTGNATITGNKMHLVAKKLGITVKTENWVKQ